MKCPARFANPKQFPRSSRPAQASEVSEENCFGLGVDRADKERPISQRNGGLNDKKSRVITPAHDS